MVTKSEAGVIAALSSIRADRDRTGRYSAPQEQAIAEAERALAGTAPGFTALLMRDSLLDTPVLGRAPQA